MLVPHPSFVNNVSYDFPDADTFCVILDLVLTLKAALKQNRTPINFAANDVLQRSTQTLLTFGRIKYAVTYGLPGALLTVMFCIHANHSIILLYSRCQQLLILI